ncbi:MAG: cytochrome c peroxidase, partial [Geminicoccaceae bacterium]
MLGRLLSSTALISVMIVMPALSKSDPAHGIKPIEDEDFYQAGHFDEAKVELGRLLFFDKILSGNRNIACATCHHPTLATADAVSLPLGEGARGLGRGRKASVDTPLLGRVPRNSPALFFLGANEFDRLYYDGRVEQDERQNWKSGFWSPAREQLPTGLD